MNWLRYANQNATRNRPLSSRMTDALSFLPELGVSMEVFSGGQGAAGDGARVGSTRHDHGDAADVFFYKDGRKLDWNNPDDLPLFREIVSRGRQSGLTGFGAGQGYMQPGSMHVGFGDEAVWGAGGKGANAPEWLRASYGGQSPQQSSRSPQQSSQSSQGVGNTQQFPAGILSTQGAAPMEREQAGGLLGSLFPNMGADRADEMRLAWNGMQHNPNRGRAAAIGARMDERRDGRERQRVQGEKQEQANKTAQWLSGQPGGQQYAQAIAGGALPAGEALRMWQAASKGPEYTQITGPEAEAKGLAGDRVYNVGADGKVSGIGGGDTNIDLGAGETAFDKKTGEHLAQEAADIVTQGAMAQRSMGQIGRLGQVLEEVPEGMQGAFVNIASNLGVKFDGSSDVEAANAIISQLVPQQRQPGSGTMSDQDLALFKQSLPRLINTREGNRMIIDTMAGIAEYDMQRGRIARAMQMGELTPQQASEAYNNLGNPLANFLDESSSGWSTEAPSAAPQRLRYNPETGEFE